MPIAETYRPDAVVHADVRGHAARDGAVCLVDVGDDAAADLAGLVVDQAQDDRLVGSAGVGALARVPVLVLAAHPRRIGDDGAGEQAGEWVALYRLADAMEHEPGRLGGQLVLALHLAGADPVLVAAHLEDHQQSRADGDLRAVEDRARQNRELLAAVAALPHPAL